MAAVPVEPGQQTVGFSVTVIFELDLTRGRDVDRNAVEHGGARQRVELTAVVELVDVDAGLVGGDALAGAAAVVTPPVRQRNDAAAHASAPVSTGATRSPPGPLMAALSVSLSSAASSGWICSVQRFVPPSERGQVVHPAVVRAQVPATDERRSRRRCGRGIPASLAASAMQRIRREFDSAR